MSAKKFTITKREAIRECKKIWKLVVDCKAENKYDAFEILYGDRYINKWALDCPLCEYVDNFDGRCTKCPLVVQLGGSCGFLGYNGQSGNRGFAKLVMKLK